MPTAPLRLCSGKSNCPNRVQRGKCKDCARVSEQARGTSTERGYGSAWQRLRDRVRTEEPLCRRCLAKDLIQATEEVDHIVPKSDGGTDDRANLQGLCKSCHSRKTMTEDNGVAR
jgi:5-methylcytosine-specific restriction protein A